MDFLNSSAGQTLLAEAAMAAVALFAARQVNGDGTSETLSHPIDALQRAGRDLKERTEESRESLARNSARLQFALGEAVRAFRTALAEPHVPDAGDDAPRATEPEATGGK